MEQKKMSLKERAMALQAVCPLMEGRDKGELSDLIGQIVTIKDCDTMKSDDGDYVVFVVEEEPTKFFFGGQVLTDQLKQLVADGCLEQIQTEGLPMVLSTKKGKKSKREYTAVTWYPEG